MGGVGGFKGDIYLESENSKTRFDKNLWKFKHTAFTMNTYFQTHNISYTELKNDYSPIEKLTQTKLVNLQHSHHDASTTTLLLQSLLGLLKLCRQVLVLTLDCIQLLLEFFFFCL